MMDVTYLLNKEVYVCSVDGLESRQTVFTMAFTEKEDAYKALNDLETISDRDTRWYIQEVVTDPEPSNDNFNRTLNNMLSYLLVDTKCIDENAIKNVNYMFKQYFQDNRVYIDVKATDKYGNTAATTKDIDNMNITFCIVIDDMIRSIDLIDPDKYSVEDNIRAALFYNNNAISEEDMIAFKDHVKSLDDDIEDHVNSLDDDIEDML